MEKFSKFIKKCGFTFSFKRLKRAIVLVILFLGIGLGVHFIYEFGNSESGLKMMYEKEIASKIDIEDNSVIRIYKKDINEDKELDYIFIIGKEKRSSEDTLNSTLELYKNVSFVIIDGKTDEIIKYDTNKDYKSDVSLKIVEDEENRYFLISDYSGNVELLKIKENNIVNITSNTTSGELLGYTIYTSKDEEKPNVLKVKIDNYGKDYLKEYKEEKELDLTNLSIDLTKYRETYLRDKISRFEFKDINNDGIFEFVTTQYVLYSLDEIATSNKTIGKIEIYYNINGDKLVFNKVEINI
ncbi:MAG: hypothetical protein ACI4ON_02720 [Clostridia bacterium]